MVVSFLFATFTRRKLNQYIDRIMNTLFKHIKHGTDYKGYATTSYFEIFTFLDNKFRIKISIEDGDPLGYPNPNCHLSIMDSNGAFAVICDDRDIGARYKNNYRDSEIKQEMSIEDCVKDFKDFVAKVY